MRTRGVQITFRTSDGQEDHDTVDFLGVIGEQRDGRRVLTRIRVRSGYDERERTQAISRLTALQPPGGEEIRGRLAIMLWLRELAAIATDADREAAGLEAADQVAADEAEFGASEEIVARKLRLGAWIGYADSNGSHMHREVIVVSLHGEPDDEVGFQIYRVEAYCHLRRGARTFLVDRMTGIGESQEAFAEMDTDDINAWLLRSAKRPKRKGRRSEGDSAHD